MHRDVKPSNIIIDASTKTIKLIDWGLSDFYFPGKAFHTRVSSRPFKSPELLLDHKIYDFAMDVWSAGCILAGLLFRTSYFFIGKDNEDQLCEIVNILGREEFDRYVVQKEIPVHSALL